MIIVWIMSLVIWIFSWIGPFSGKIFLFNLSVFFAINSIFSVRPISYANFGGAIISCIVIYYYELIEIDSIEVSLYFTLILAAYVREKMRQRNTKPKIKLILIMSFIIAFCLYMIPSFQFLADWTIFLIYNFIKIVVAGFWSLIIWIFNWLGSILGKGIFITELSGSEICYLILFAYSLALILSR